MTLEEFETVLKKHDWFSAMSDDHRVWKRGQEEFKKIREMVNQQPEFENIFNQYKKERMI